MSNHGPSIARIAKIDERTSFGHTLTPAAMDNVLVRGWQDEEDDEEAGSARSPLR